MTASALTTKNKTGPRLSGSDPHGAIQIRSFGGKMKIVNLWLMPAPSTLLADHPQAFGAPRKVWIEGGVRQPFGRSQS
jgi:hypothetical protein